MKKYKIIVVLLFAVSFSSCKKSSFEDTPSQVSLYQIISDDTQFNLFKYAVDKAGLRDLLDGSNDITLIAPTNSALVGMGYSNSTGTTMILESLPKAEVELLVKSHIINSRLDLNTLTGTNDIATQNKMVAVTRKGDAFYVDGGDITRSNVAATNGLLHVSNKLLVPERISILEAINANVNLTFLVAAITKASQGSTDFTQLLSGSQQYTLFAPTNAAFIAGGYANIAAVTAASPESLEALLKRYIIPGRKLTSDLDSIPQSSLGGTIYFDRERLSKNVQFVTTESFINGVHFTGSSGSITNKISNVIAQNGVYHSILQFIPASVTTNTLQRINSDPDLTFLTAAITRASQGSGTDFVNLLSDPLKSYTIFAPNNAAFQAAGYQTVASINAESPGVLTKLLQYHMFRKRVAVITFAEGAAYPTLLQLPNSAGILTNASLTFTTTGGYKVKGNTNPAGVAINPMDVITTNGSLNVIGSILTP